MLPAPHGVAIVALLPIAAKATQVGNDITLTFSTPDAVAVAGTLVAVAVAVAVGWAHHTQLARSRVRLEKVREQMLAALDLHRVVVEDKELEHAVHDIASQFARVSEQEDPLLIRLAHRDLDKATHFIGMGAEGHITFGADAFSHAEFLASALLDTTEDGDEFWASSFVRTDFWSLATGYMRKQEEKLERQEEKVTIRRVFGFATLEEAVEDHAQAQMKRQHEIKVDVRCLIERTLAPRDLLVVLKPDQSEQMVPKYAMVCRLGNDRRIDHIDLWAAQGLKSEMVENTWGELHDLFSKSDSFPLGPAPLAPIMP
jgi:hypothetical protein